MTLLARRLDLVEQRLLRARGRSHPWTISRAAPLI
jgi:hypothetical protein